MRLCGVVEPSTGMPEWGEGLKAIHDPRYLEVIARLRAARKRQRISQAELGRRLGKPQTYISKVETGERRLDLIEALRFCEALGISIEAIVPSELRHLLRATGYESPNV